MITRDAFRQDVARCIGSAPEEIAGDANLIQLGMSSIDMMKLVNGWRREGLPVAFKELVREPTLDGWWRYLDGLRAKQAEARS